MKRIGEYEIVEQLREEELGLSYRATRGEEEHELLVLGEGVLKSRSSRKRFMERLRRVVTSKAVGSWTACFEDEGRVVLVQPALAGETLAEALAAQKTYDWRRALDIGAKLATQLASAHSVEPPICHGDLRPDHVELLPGGELRLRAYAAAQVADEVTEDRERSLARLRYLSPEQLDYGEATPRSDIYALGLVLYELIAGEPVFEQATQRDIEAAKSKATELSLPKGLQHKLPEPLEALLKAMTALDPEARPARAADVARELDGMLSKSKQAAVPENEMVQKYLTRLEAEKSRRNAMLTPDDRRGIALDLGMSREELMAAEEAAELYKTRGLGYLEHQLWDDAIEQLTSAHELAPDNAENVFALAQAYFGRWESKHNRKDGLEAQRLARRCIDLDPRHPEAFKLLASLDKAIEEEKAAQVDPPGRLQVTRPRTDLHKREPGMGQLSVVAILATLLGLVFWFAVDPLGGVSASKSPAEPTPTVEQPKPTPTTPVTPTPTTPKPPVATPTTPPHPAPTPIAQASTVELASGDRFVLVPAGIATLGSPSGEGESDEQPQQTRDIAGFYIQETEVTTSAYARCVAAGFCSASYFTAWSSAAPACNFGATGRERQPMNCLSAKAAENYCAWLKSDSLRFRLPTEDEWEKAARGTTTRRFPWGDTALNCASNVAGCNPGGSVNVGSYLDDLSPVGAQDLGGNVSEWVIARSTATDFDPTPGGKHSFSTRGGSWKSKAPVRSADREPTPVPLGDAGNNAFDVGFRCVAVP